MLQSHDTFRIINVSPRLIQIEVLDFEKFKDETKDFTIGSYLKISDDSNASIVAIVESFKIKETNDLQSESELKKPSFVLDAQPIGFITEDGKFRRGGQRLAIPPNNVEIATSETIQSIYANIIDDKVFTFSTLAQNENVHVPVDGDKFFSKHVAVLGSTGSGKSGTVAKILQEAMHPTEDQNTKGVLNNTHIILFDLHGEYHTAFPACKQINVDNLVLPYWLMNAEELEDLIIENKETGSHNQVSQFRYAVTENKKRHNPNLKKVSYDTPVYFSLKEVLCFIRNMNCEVLGKLTGEDSKPKLADGNLVNDRRDCYFTSEQQFVVSSTAATTKASNGPFHGDFDRFILRMESKFNDDRLSFLLNPSKVDGSDYKSGDLEEIFRQFTGYHSSKCSNITVLDLSGIPFEVICIVVSLISRIVFDFCFYYKVIKDEGREAPFLLVLEEAHNYIPQSGGAKYDTVKKSIERIAKEGRKYGLSLMIVSQRPSEISETIFSQCSNFVTMRLTNPTDQNYVKKLLPDSIQALTDTLPILERQEALLIGDSVCMPSLVRIIDLDTNKPSSNDIDFRSEWKKDWNDIVFADLVKKLSKEI